MAAAPECSTLAKGQSELSTEAGDDAAGETAPSAAPSGSLARRGLAYGLGTLLSRLLGLARDVLIARDLGTSVEASALVVAQTLPNLARTLAADDIAQGVLVPVFTRRIRESPAPETVALARVVAILLTVALSIAAVLTLGLVAPLARYLAPGFSPASRSALVEPLMTKFVAGLAFSGMGAVGSAFLIIRQRYFAAASAVAASNVPTIVLLLATPYASVSLIAVGLVAGFFCQGLLQTLLGGAASRASARRTARGLRLSAVGRRDMRLIAKLAVPVSISLGMANISGIIDAAYCSLVSTAGPAAFEKAFRLALVPYGVVAIAIGVASVNAFVAAADDRAEFSRHLTDALRLQLALLLPAALVLAVFARPFVQLAFGRGHFDAASVTLTAKALRGTATILPALGLSALGTRAWTTRERPWVPAVLGCAGLAGNLVLDVLLVGPMGLIGIALSTTIVHCAVGMLLIASAVDDTLQLVRSAVRMAAQGICVGAAVCGPMGVLFLLHGNAGAGMALAALGLGLLIACPIAVRVPGNEYRALAAELRRRTR